jgi:hypothetical protein
VTDLSLTARSPRRYPSVGMESWLARRHSLLVLLVCTLAALAFAGVVVSRSAVAEALATRAGSLFAAPETRMPALIEIGPPAPSAATEVPAGPAAAPSSQRSAGGSPAPPAVMVVSPPVYTYPAHDHGGSGSGSSSGGRDGGPTPSPGGGHGG